LTPKRTPMYFFLKETKATKETLIYLKYRINSTEGRFVYSTKQKIKPIDWSFENKTVKSRRGRTDIAIINNKLNELSNYLELLLNNYKINKINITKSNLKKEFDIKFNKKNKEIQDVFYYFDIMLKEKKVLSSGTVKKYENCKKNLLGYQKWKGKILKFKDFENFSDYAIYSKKKLPDNIDNTLSKHYSFIKTFVKWAYRKGLHDIRDYSSLKYNSYETDNVALTKKQVFELYNFHFNNERLQRVVDIFLIGCLTGQRFSDFSIFDKIDYNNGFLTKRQKKTKAKVVIPVDANIMLKTLLYRYDFNLPKISSQNFNSYLREALNKLESFQHETKKTSYKNGNAIINVCKFWEMVASHTARRTFITVTLEDGWTYKEVMQVSGITDVKTLMKYDKVSNQRLNSKTKQTWNQL